MASKVRDNLNLTKLDGHWANIFDEKENTKDQICSNILLDHYEDGKLDYKTAFTWNEKSRQMIGVDKGKYAIISGMHAVFDKTDKSFSMMEVTDEKYME